MSNKSIPSGIEIKTQNPSPFNFCGITNLNIKNKSNGIIYYNFGGVKFELAENEEDNYPSPHNTMEGKIEFNIPQGTSTVYIKIKTVQKI